MKNTVHLSKKYKILFISVLFLLFLSSYFYGYLLLKQKEIFTLGYVYKLDGTPWGPPATLRKIEVTCTLDNQLQSTLLTILWSIPKYIEECYWQREIRARNGSPFFINKNGIIEEGVLH